MRFIALTIIFLSELLVLALISMDISAQSLSLFSTLIIVVLVAFGLSALLKRANSIKVSRNYSISGIAGILSGIVYYLTIKDHLELTAIWLKNYGIHGLLLLIFLASLVLFFSQKSGKNQNNNKTATEDNKAK